MPTYILTRYDIPMKFATGVQPVVDDKWLTHRKSLFMKCCLPSVLNQVDQDFVWIIGFSDKFHDETVLGALPKNAKPLFCRSSDDFYRQISSLVEAETTSEQIIISSRLDNDDAIAWDFVKLINNFSSFSAKLIHDFGGRIALNFRTGAVWDVDSNTYYKKDYPSSSFVTLFFNYIPGEPIKTVLDYHHAWIHKSVHVVNMPTPNPMWCITIHGNNVGNEVSGVRDDSLRLIAGKSFGFISEE
jgi:hypothetical protein